jgi:hypothetical protein
MAKANVRHLEQWRLVLVREYEASTRAYNASISYIDSRLSAFVNPKETLLDVEQREFGYSPEGGTAAALG